MDSTSDIQPRPNLPVGWSRAPARWYLPLPRPILMRSTAWRGPLLITALALLWGSNFAWIKVSLDAFTPTQLTFGRMILGALVLVAVLALRHDHLPRGGRVWAHLAVAALIGNALPFRSRCSVLPGRQ